MSKNYSVVYKLDNINSDDGVDIFEIAPILMSFGELIRSANTVLGNTEQINVKVKPFKEGSWITEFIFQNSAVHPLINYMQTGEGTNLLLIMNFLGLNVKEGITGVANIIRFTKGKVLNFKKSEDTTKVTYFNENGDSIEVTVPEHRLVQSPLIQINYYNGVLSPFDKFPTVGSVTVVAEDKQGNNAERFSEIDKDYFAEYASTELLEEVEVTPIRMQGVYLKPKRGSYTGEDRAYSFFMGESVLYPTTIEDKEFLMRLKTGEIRLYQEDILQVNLEIRQKKDATNKIVNHYAIENVINYIPYQRAKQILLPDLDTSKR